MRLYLNLLWILFLMKVGMGGALAQTSERGKVYGYVKDSITLIPLAYITVYNTVTKQSALTDENGLFFISVDSLQHLKVFSAGYLDNNFVYTGRKYHMDTLEIWLQPKTTQLLPGVTVSAYSYKDYQSDSLDRHNEFMVDAGPTRKLFEGGNSGAGIGISLDKLFSKKESAKRKSYETFSRIEKEKYIDFRFNSTVVHTYSGLTGAKLKDFMNRYRPTYDWLRDNTSNDDIKYYIVSKLRLFYNKERLSGPDGTVKPADTDSTDD